MREGPAGDSARGGRWSDVLVRLDGCWNESRNFWVGIPWRLCHGIAEATPVASVGYRKCGVPGMPLTRVWGLFGTAGGGEGKCGSEEGGGGSGGSRVCMYVCMRKSGNTAVALQSRRLSGRFGVIPTVRGHVARSCLLGTIARHKG